MKQKSSLFSMAALGAAALAFSPFSVRALETPSEPKFHVESTPINRNGQSQTSYAPIVKKAAPSVVNIYSTRTLNLRQRHPFLDDPMFRQFFGDDGNSNSPSSRRQRLPQEKGLGSGVIVSSDGYILTANHVIDGADSDGVKVALTDGGKEFAAKVVGADAATDIAVLKVEAHDLPMITFADSDQLEVGDVVLAIGNPFGVGQTVTKGIVSALGRTSLGVLGRNGYEDFIQTDAAINQGNSGGALIDSTGLLIGINTAIYSPRTGGSVGIGFAIPTSIVMHVMDQIVHTGRVHHGFFGIEPFDITPELAEAMRLKRADGVVVNGVLRNAPAGRAGMEPGDILLTINGTAVSATRTMLNQIAQLEPGSVATVRVMRENRELDLNITVGERPPPQSPR